MLLKTTDPVMVRNVTLSADVHPGDVLIFGNRPEICTNRGFAGERNYGVGTFGGEYSGTADGAIAAGDEVYYNKATGKVTKTVTGAKHLGFCTWAPSNCADGSEILIWHAPNGTAK